MGDNDKNKAGIWTPVFRVSFPELFEAKKFGEGDAKFSITMLFEKGTNIQELRDLAKAAAIGRWGEKLPNGLKTPFRDGAEKEHLDGYGAGVVFVRATSTIMPAVADIHKKPILSQRELYAGCYARAKVAAFAYDNKSKGVSFGLRAIIKIRDGASFGAGGNPATMFDDAPDDVGAVEAQASNAADPFADA